MRTSGRKCSHEFLEISSKKNKTQTLGISRNLFFAPEAQKGARPVVISKVYDKAKPYQTVVPKVAAEVGYLFCLPILRI